MEHAFAPRGKLEESPSVIGSTKNVRLWTTKLWTGFTISDCEPSRPPPLLTDSRTGLKKSAFFTKNADILSSAQKRGHFKCPPKNALLGHLIENGQKIWTGRLFRGFGWTNRELPWNERPAQNSGSSKNFLFLRGLTPRKNIPNISSLRKVQFVRTLKKAGLCSEWQINQVDFRSFGAQDFFQWQFSMLNK